ncbi:MAG: DNA polymerase III subunit delta [Candidatus Neomarinimicrobiota bacterium]|jgi:DNA polymerase-3 subunit delta|nr:DNA polymerase III subunit delta [Candidatus Neomarinimicrobiota bacterium]MDX9780835.1 DNA polymerase III subunit delta [bacterium]
MSWLSEFEHEIHSVRNGELKPVYFCYGADPYLRDHAISEIRKALKTAGISYDYTIISGTDSDAGEIRDLLFGTSLFQSARCTVIFDVKGLLPSARKILLQYLQQATPGNTLILTAEALDYKNALYKRIQEHAVTLMTTTPFESEIPAWVRKYLAGYNRQISAAAISELLRLVGADLGKLSNELDKLDIYLPDGREVNEADVRMISGQSMVYGIDDLMIAIGKKDKAAAVGICRNLIENGISGVYLVVALYQFIWKLIMLKDARLLNQTKDLAKSIRVFRAKQLEELRIFSLRYNMRELRQAVTALVDADRRQKTTSCDDLANFMIALDGIMGS